jgi:hypothetical protein
MSRIFARWPAIVAGILVLVAPCVGAPCCLQPSLIRPRRRTLNGIVTKVDWSNPHVHVLMNVSKRRTGGELGVLNLRANSSWSTADGRATSVKPGVPCRSRALWLATEACKSGETRSS